ncbi:S-adenosyl-L-methionine-dependent methyltransferase [Aureobasidium subglaciale]|nr:S-adenosyl-L-methionine-dependent methyltransferase [Aureobasidium subglaciale]
MTKTLPATDAVNGHAASTSVNLLYLLRTVNSTSITSDLERAQLISATRSFLARIQSPWETIRSHLVDSPAVQLSLKVCMDLGLFQKWKDAGNGEKTAAELAVIAGCDEQLLHRFLRHLAVEHLLAEVASGTYAQTDFTMALCTPHFGAWPLYMHETVLDTWKAMPGVLAERGYKNDALSVTDGAFQAAHHTVGQSIFDFFATNPSRAKTFNNAMTGYGAEKCSWLDIYPTDDLLDGAIDGPLLVDVGGNIGHDIEKFRKKHLNTAPRLILQDLPAVVETAICADNVRIMPHNFFEPQPILHARAYYLHSVLHDWSDVNALQILNNLKPAMKKNCSKLLLNEIVILDKISASSPQVTSFDLAMMGLCAAQERTESMWRALLDQAGFKVIKIWTSETAVESIIEAEIA